MSEIIPCQPDAELRSEIRAYANVLLTQGHQLGSHGLVEDEFYRSGIFRGAIESVRGTFSATKRSKKEFVRHILNYMEDRGYIATWKETDKGNRHDYQIELPSGRTAIIELKGCPDGNNINLYDRPAHAEEFIIWSVCTNAGSDFGHGVWSGIHTRLSAEMIKHPEKRVDGLVVWDMMCAHERACPKVEFEPDRLTDVGPFRVPPTCIYVFPRTTPTPRNNPTPVAQSLSESQLLTAFHECFRGQDHEVNYVDFEVDYKGSDIRRRMIVRRNGTTVRESKLTPIRRA